MTVHRIVPAAKGERQETMMQNANAAAARLRQKTRLANEAAKPLVKPILELQLRDAGKKAVLKQLDDLMAGRDGDEAVTLTPYEWRVIKEHMHSYALLINAA